MFLTLAEILTKIIIVGIACKCECLYVYAVLEIILKYLQKLQQGAELMHIMVRL